MSSLWGNCVHFFTNTPPKEFLMRLLKVLSPLVSVQCTKRTWCVCVTCRQTRTPLIRPAKPGSPSSYWYLYGWEGRPSIRPTLNVWRSGNTKAVLHKELLPHTNFLTILSLNLCCHFQNILKLECCIGIIGGKPKHSLYFMGFQGKSQRHHVHNFTLNYTQYSSCI